MHQCSMIYQEMGSLTLVRHGNGKTHVEVTTSRRIRGEKGLATLRTWFQQRNPFDPADGLLTSLSMGLAAAPESEINCDGAEAVSSVIRKTLDRVSVEGAIVKRTNQVRSLEILHTSISVENAPIHINSMVLFGRLTTLIKQEDEGQQFVHELTPKPTSQMGILENRTNLSCRLVAKNLQNLQVELALLMEEICYTTCPGFYPVHVATSSINTPNIHLQTMATVAESLSSLTDMNRSAQPNPKSILTGFRRG